MIEASHPLVSVVMPVHNGALYLSDAIKSILSQTYRHFEFIIINDGSSDDTESIVKSFNDSRIKYHVFTKQQGIVSALNYGLTLAKGDFIARMDADDISLKHRLAKQVDKLLNNADIAILGTQYIGINGRSRSLPVLHDDIIWHTLNASPFVHPSVMFRTSFIKLNNIKYNADYQFAEDLALWVECSSLTRMANLNERLIKYRYHNGTHKKNMEQVALLNTKIKIDLIQKLIPVLDAGDCFKLAVCLNRHLTHEYSLLWFKSTLAFFDELILKTRGEVRLQQALNKCVWFHLTAKPGLFLVLNKELKKRTWISIGIRKTMWLILKRLIPFN
jgi:glycosyltransferase involved in cell wall biosynthesis